MVIDGKPRLFRRKIMCYDIAVYVNIIISLGDMFIFNTVLEEHPLRFGGAV